MNVSSSPTSFDGTCASIHAAPTDFARDYCAFIAASPTAYHAAAAITAVLSNAGFRQQNEGDAWAGTRTGFTSRDGAVIAWRIPEHWESDAGVRIVGAHTDSPSFHVKPIADTETLTYGQVNVEVYGGPLLNSWLNRDLGLAGRLVMFNGEEKLVHTDTVMTIPQIAPHLDRSANKELKLSAQRDYHPIWNISGKSIIPYVADVAGVKAADIAAMDVFAYDTQPPRLLGEAESNFIAAGRQDNLSSVYAALSAFVQTQQCPDIQVFAAFNNEEIGSRTYSGAAGTFLESVLRRIVEHERGVGSEAFERALAHSSCVSADAGHAVNPNRPDLHDPSHQVLLGSGPLVKIHSSGAYASTALTQALLERAARTAGVKLQAFVSHNDVPCGTTIGPLTTTRLGIATVDCGIPLLSMHSVRELSSPIDLRDFAQLLAAYMEA